MRMKRSLFRNFQHMPLEVKLKLLFAGILIPLAFLISLLLVALIRYNSQYNRIVRNVTVASEFSFDFKKTLDYKMYRYVISGRNFELFAPLDDVEHARAIVEKLNQTTTRADSRDRLQYIGKFLDSLEARILDIKSGIGGYDWNMDRLEHNIYILTELISDSMHEYIYYETCNLADIQQRTYLEIRRTVLIIAMASVVMVCLLWLVAVRTSKSITRPLKELCENIRMVGEGDFTIRPVASQNDEVQTLSESFDRMVGRIGTLMMDIRQEQVNLRRTELKLLQAQINPHFLYNTFDTVIWLAEDHKDEQVVELITSLSTFFRTTLSKGEDFIRLREEALHVKSYLEIQQVRYCDIMEYEISIPEQLGEYTVLKLTLQPLVENALYHGIKNKRGKGKITVCGHKDGQLLELMVRDNGIGIRPDLLSKLRDSIYSGNKVGFGLANVHERIQLYYGKEYGLRINSEYGVGTEVVVRLPAKIIQPVS